MLCKRFTGRGLIWSGYAVWWDWAGVLYLVGGALSFDELSLGLALDWGGPLSLSRSRARLSTGVADRQLSAA